MDCPTAKSLEKLWIASKQKMGMISWAIKTKQSSISMTKTTNIIKYQQRVRHPTRNWLWAGRKVKYWIWTPLKFKVKLSSGKKTSKNRWNKSWTKFHCTTKFNTVRWSSIRRPSPSTWITNFDSWRTVWWNRPKILIKSRMRLRTSSSMVSITCSPSKWPSENKKHSFSTRWSVITSSLANSLARPSPKDCRNETRP